MNYGAASKVAEEIKAIGGFSEIEVEHHGFISVLTDEVKNDGRWSVLLWTTNARAGNRNLYTISDLPRDQKHLRLLAKAAKGKATDRDREAINRFASEKANA